MAFQLQQPSLFLSRPYYINKNNFPSYLTAFKELIVNIVKELKSSPAISSFPNLSGPLNLKYIEAKAAEIVAFEEEIAKLSRDGVETQYGLRNFTATLTLNYLQAIFNNYTTPNSTNKVCKDHIINGPMLFRKILKIIMLKPSCIMDIKLELKKLLDFTFRTAGTTISETQLVSMSDTNYMGNMFELLSTTPVEVLANYLHFRMLSWVVSGTTAAMRGHIHKYQRVVYGITEPSPRLVSLKERRSKAFLRKVTHNTFQIPLFYDADDTSGHFMISEITCVHPPRKRNSVSLLLNRT